MDNSREFHRILEARPSRKLCSQGIRRNACIATSLNKHTCKHAEANIVELQVVMLIQELNLCTIFTKVEVTNPLKYSGVHMAAPGHNWPWIWL